MTRSCFVHMPKCGGTSIRLALEKLLGQDNLRLDYSGVPGDSELARHQQLLKYLDNPVSVDPGCCIYGHFRPIKYLGASGIFSNDISVFTILRDPIDRLISHYRFLLALNESSNPMRVALRDHHDDFAWFSMQPRLRNIYSRHLYQVPVARVTYLGLYEKLDDSWLKISSILRPGKSTFPLPMVNTTSNCSSEVIPQPEISDSLRSELQDFHAEDVALHKYVSCNFLIT